MSCVPVQLAMPAAGCFVVPDSSLIDSSDLTDLWPRYRSPTPRKSRCKESSPLQLFLTHVIVHRKNWGLAYVRKLWFSKGNKSTTSGRMEGRSRRAGAKPGKIPCNLNTTWESTWWTIQVMDLWWMYLSVQRTTIYLHTWRFGVGSQRVSPMT
jgi:hypothetical protein